MNTGNTFAGIRSLYDVSNYVDEIQDYVKMNPDTDIVLYFPTPINSQRRGSGPETMTNIPYGINLQGNKVVIAGSAALHYLQQRGIYGSFSGATWKASDVDVFILNCNVNDRFPMGTVDLVKAKETTVEQLLLNFDLGCCRVAYDLEMNFWVSLQCFNAIFKHWYPMPKYLKEKKTFQNVLLENRNKEQRKMFGDGMHHGAENMMYDRFLLRLKKYSDRGFGVRWVDTTTILPWVKNRFHYAEWVENPSAEDESTILTAEKLRKREQFAEFIRVAASQQPHAFPSSSLSSSLSSVSMNDREVPKEKEECC